MSRGAGAPPLRFRLDSLQTRVVNIGVSLGQPRSSSYEDTRGSRLGKRANPSKLNRWTSKAPKRARSWSSLRQPASVIPTPSPCPATTPRACFRPSSAMRGPAVVVEVGPEVSSVKPGDHVIPLYTPEDPNCPFIKSGKTNLCQTIRGTQGRGLMPDETSRFSSRGKTIYHYMGNQHLQRIHRPARNRHCGDPERSPAGEGVSAGLRGHDRHRGSEKHGQGRTRQHNCHLRVGRHRAGRGSRLGSWPRPRGSSPLTSIRPNLSWPKSSGRLSVSIPRDYDAPIQDVIVDMTDGGVDYSFECIGNVNTMRAALECSHKGWGESIIIGVAGAGPGDLDPPVHAGHRSGVARGRPSVASKAARNYPGLSIKPRPATFRSTIFITHTMPLDEVNTAFDLMHQGKSIRSVVHY